MEVIEVDVCPPDEAGGFSVVMVEQVFRMARLLSVQDQWRGMWIGNPSGRKIAYQPEQRIGSIVSALSCGLRGLAPANLLLRPSSAVMNLLGGRFPDQGTMHRWLDQVTAEQAEALRSHLHRVVREHGRFRQELWSNRMLFVDIDGQGLIARGQRFERAAGGYMDDGLDHGYQRYVCYVGETREVLDEWLAPGNQTLMTALPESVRGLNEVFPRWERRRVILRMDSHGGTLKNLKCARRERATITSVRCTATGP